jgi:hypothetical protein
MSARSLEKLHEEELGDPGFRIWIGNRLWRESSLQPEILFASLKDYLETGDGTPTQVLSSRSEIQCHLFSV